ncbi:hypothetical protein BDW66DRAFT_65635 [Aspergillus desertorum]
MNWTSALHSPVTLPLALYRSVKCFAAWCSASISILGFPIIRISWSWWKTSRGRRLHEFLRDMPEITVLPGKAAKMGYSMLIPFWTSTTEVWRGMIPGVMISATVGGMSGMFFV